MHIKMLWSSARNDETRICNQRSAHVSLHVKKCYGSNEVVLHRGWFERYFYGQETWQALFRIDVGEKDVFTEYKPLESWTFCDYSFWWSFLYKQSFTILDSDSFVVRCYFLLTRHT